MVRPEPGEPFREADLGCERGGKPRLGFVEIDLLRSGARPCRRTWRRRVPRIACGSFGRRSIAAPRLRALRLRALLRGCGSRASFVAAGLLEGEGRARRGAAAHELAIREATGIRTIEFGDERAARIGCDRADRTGARAEPEPVQR